MADVGLSAINCYCFTTKYLLACTNIYSKKSRYLKIKKFALDFILRVLLPYVHLILKKSDLPNMSTPTIMFFGLICLPIIIYTLLLFLYFELNLVK